MFWMRYVTVLMILVQISFILSIAAVNFAQQPCRDVDACRCRFDNGSEINLHLINASTGNPQFVNVRGSGGNFYTYSPCEPFKCGSSSAEAAICRTDLTRKTFLCLGEIGTQAFERDDKANTYRIRYKAKGKNLTSVVYLACKTESDFKVNISYNKTTFQFTLYSPCACVDGCVNPPSAPRLSVGSVLLLVFFSLVLLYFGVGSLYRKTVYGAEGREIIPNTSFWFALPGLIKDGYLFFISPCLGDRVEYRYYDRL